MITFIELWKANENWKQTSMTERSEYLSKMQPSIPAFLDKGATIIGWGQNDKAVDCKANYDYFAIWSFPDEDLALQFKTLLQDANWYHYFDQINVCGENESPDVIIKHMIGDSN